jgi:uncharacterized membrane protein HdeD (DUF308 family)
MLDKISRNWWMFALRGLVAVIFGVLALVKQEQVLQALVLVFGAFALVHGVITVFTGLSSAPFFSRWWALLLEGIAGIVCGLAAIFMPEITTTALMYVFGVWAIFAGILEIVVAIEFRNELKDEWMLVLGGILSIVFGVLLFVYPSAGAVSMTWMIGIFAIIYGISEIVFAFRLREARGDFEKTKSDFEKAIGAGSKSGSKSSSGSTTGSTSGTTSGSTSGSGN